MLVSMLLSASLRLHETDKHLLATKLISIHSFHYKRVHPKQWRVLPRCYALGMPLRASLDQEAIVFGLEQAR